MQTKTWHQKKTDLWFMVPETPFVVLLLQCVHVVTEWNDKGQSLSIFSMKSMTTFSKLIAKLNKVRERVKIGIYAYKIVCIFLNKLYENVVMLDYAIGMSFLQRKAMYSSLFVLWAPVKKQERCCSSHENSS